MDTYLLVAESKNKLLVVTLRLGAQSYKVNYMPALSKISDRRDNILTIVRGYTDFDDQGNTRLWAEINSYDLQTSKLSADYRYESNSKNIFSY